MMTMGLWKADYEFALRVGDGWNAQAFVDALCAATGLDWTHVDVGPADRDDWRNRLMNAGEVLMEVRVEFEDRDVSKQIESFALEYVKTGGAIGVLWGENHTDRLFFEDAQGPAKTRGWVSSSRKRRSK